jgi:hypothetical protein
MTTTRNVEEGSGTVAAEHHSAVFNGLTMPMQRFVANECEEGNSWSIPHLQIRMDPLLVRHNDVQQAVAVEIADPELRTDARIIVDQVGHEANHTVGGFLSFEPVKHARAIGAGVALGTVRPPAPAGDQILEAVAIEIGTHQGVGLRQQFLE